MIGAVIRNSSPGGASNASQDATAAAAPELTPLCAWTETVAVALPTATAGMARRTASNLLRNNGIMGPMGERYMGANHSMLRRSPRVTLHVALHVTLRDSQSLIN